jgi:hypothetical protein
VSLENTVEKRKFTNKEKKKILDELQRQKQLTDEFNVRYNTSFGDLKAAAEFMDVSEKKLERIIEHKNYGMILNVEGELKVKEGFLSSVHKRPAKLPAIYLAGTLIFGAITGIVGYAIGKNLSYHVNPPVKDVRELFVKPVYTEPTDLLNKLLQEPKNTINFRVIENKPEYISIETKYLDHQITITYDARTYPVSNKMLSLFIHNGYTVFNISDGGAKIRPFDGLADIISIAQGGNYVHLDRARDFDSLKNDFITADNILVLAKKIFKDYLPQ